MVRKIGKTVKYLYEGGCIGNEIGELLELAAIVELEPWRARASMKSGQRPTPNIGLFCFCWILKIRRLPILGLEFEVESQKWFEPMLTQQSHFLPFGVPSHRPARKKTDNLCAVFILPSFSLQASSRNIRDFCKDIYFD